MAKAITFGALKSRVKFLGRFERSRVVSDARVGEAVNNGIETVWDVLLKRRPDSYVLEVAAATIANNPAVALAARFYKLRMVSILDAGIYWRVRAHNLSERDKLEATRAGGSPRSLKYRIQGGSLYFAPTPTRVYTLQVHYLPAFADLVVDADTFDGINGYDDLAVMLALVELKGRDVLEAQHWQAKADALLAQISTVASDMDEGEAFSLSGGSPEADGSFNPYDPGRDPLA